MAANTSVNTVRVCPVCSYKGVTVTLKLYQINEDEAVYMCSDKQCTYPIGACDPSLVIVKRSVPGLKQDERIPKEKVSHGEGHNESTTTVDQIDEAKTELDLMLEGILSEDPV